MSGQSDSKSAMPWHAAYPPPSSTEPGKMTRQQVLSLLKSSDKVAGRDFVLVDLRRNDHEVRASRDLDLYPRPVFTDILFRIVGRHHSRVYQPAGPEPVSYLAHVTCHAASCQRFSRDLVLL